MKAANKDATIFEMTPQVKARLQSDARRILRMDRLGQCFCEARTIFINDKHRKTFNRTKYTKFHLKYTLKKHIHTKWNYNALRHVLVHELVHYRFGYTRHGWRFEEKIEAVLRGKRFEPEHVHLFANCPRWKVQNIDG